jgi:putative ABC transport system ATP-binding protein
MAESKSIIELQKVTRTYRLESEVIHALNDVTFKVKPGEHVSITGPSGSGKSTLVNIIGGLDTPTSGTVVVDGQNLSNMHDDKLSAYRNQTIGFVFQSFNLQPANTILENVMLPLVFSGVEPEERKKRATEYLNTVGLGNRLDHKPNQLSSGQQQLTAIARALITQPKILIADEPTGNLDSARGQEILEILHKINEQGTTLLVVTHDPNTAHLSDRIVQMSDGRLTELRV